MPGQRKLSSKYNRDFIPKDLVSHKHFKNFTKEKLLVLDIDKTLCNFGKKNFRSTNPIIARPHLHTFLKDVSEYYELAVWSATSYNTIVTKLLSLGIRNNKNFQISFLLDKYSMISVNENGGRRSKLAKPLDVIWKRCDPYNSTNTIILDDLPINFHFNPNNGLQIVPYEQNMSITDKELIQIGEYLINLAKNCADFTTVDHSNYKNYNPNP